MLYLDNSATTQVHPEVKDAMLPYLLEEYGNPSSKFYSLAENAKKAVKSARNSLALLLGCSEREIIFTSGATESNNMVIKGVADYYADRGNRIITTKTEHASVLETCRYLEKKGFDIIYLDVDRFGRINLKQLESAINEKTILVSVIWGNNELGSLNDIKHISEICYNNNVFLHTDATQVVGKIPINLEEYQGVTFLSCSAHKFYGPKGIGATFIRKDKYNVLTKITPLLHGGGQEQGFRSGTLAVHNIVGFGKAAEIAKGSLEQTFQKLYELESYLNNILKDKFGDHVLFNSDVKDKVPGIVNVQFKGVNNELLLKKLSPYLAASSGSACSSSEPSHVLSAIGLTLDEIRSSIRFSLSPFIDKNELDIFKEL